MELLLNVKISVSDLGRSMSVWPEENAFIPGIEEYTGLGFTIQEAEEDLRESMPEELFIEDGVTLHPEDFVFSLKKPYTVEHCDNVVFF